MAIFFGNTGNNTSIVTNGDGYDEYRGLTGDDIYNVNTALTDEVIISDSDGINTVVLGNAEVASSQFFDGGAQFTYASGGVLTVLGDMTNMNFVFGGGTDPFDPVAGGTSNDFDTTVAAFGVDPETLDPVTPSEGTSGTINDDGSVTVEGQPTYELTADLDSVNEGSDATFTLTTTNVDEGTEVAYTLTGVQDEDVQDGALTGTAVVGADGTATITVTLLEDEEAEAETLTVTIDEDATATADVTVVDGAAPTYALAADADSVDEGATATFTLTTTNVDEGTEVDYTISGVGAADVDGALTGTVEVGADGTATITVSIVADETTEGEETLTVTAGDQEASTVINDTSLTPAAFPLAEALADLQDAQADRTAFLNDNADNELLEDTAVIAGLNEDEEPTADEVATAIAQADAAAEVDVIGAENDVLDAKAALARAQAATFNAYATDANADDDFGADDNGDVTQADVKALYALDAIDDTTRMSDIKLNAAEAEAQADVDADETEYGYDMDGAAVLDLRNADLDGLVVKLDEFDAENNNKGDQQIDKINLPDLSDFTGILTLENMTLGADDAGDVLYTTGAAADQITSIVAKEVNPGTAEEAGAYLTFTLTTNAGGKVILTNLIKAETAYANAGVESAKELNALGRDGMLEVLDSEVVEGFTEDAVTVDELTEVEGGLTAVELQDNIADAEAAVEAFELANGDNIALLTDMREAINDFLAAEGAPDQTYTSDARGETDIVGLRDEIIAALDADPVDPDTVDQIVLDIAGGEFELVGEEATEFESAINDAFDVVTELAALDAAVEDAKDAFGDTATGGILNTLVALQEERQDQIDALADAEDALDEAEAAADGIQVLVDELESLDTAIEEAEDVLDDEGYTVESIDAANEAGTADNDIFLLGDTDSAITNFELTEADTGDTIFVGEAFAVVNAGEDEDITDDLGDVATLEAIVVDDGADTTIYFEEKAFAGNGSTDADTIEITLTGVTDAEVSIDADGFLTVA